MKGWWNILLPLFYNIKSLNRLNMPLKNKLEAEEWLDHLEQNKPLRNGTYRTSQYAWGKCDALVRKCRQNEDVDVHRKALSKYTAYLRLGNSLSIFLFHWIYWRYLYGFKTPEWITSTLSIPLGEDSIETNDFFASWSLIRKNHLITAMTSKMVSTMTTEAEQGLAADTIQS